MARIMRGFERPSNGSDLLAATFLGILIAFSVSTVLLVSQEINASPLPKPLAVAFVMSVFGKATFAHNVLLPFGLALHAAYLTAATVASVVVFRQRLGAASAFVTAALLWVGAGLVFLPVVGWGAFGLSLGARAFLFVAGTHVLYGLLLWAGSWAAFRATLTRGVVADEERRAQPAPL